MGLRGGGYASFDGCDEWKVKRPPICCSKTADHFLHKYGYSSANEVGENGMRPLHYAAFEGSVMYARSYPGCDESSRHS